MVKQPNNSDKQGASAAISGQQSQTRQHQQHQQSSSHSVLIAGSGISMVSSMSPLAIGLEGLTEQQTAEVVELLTPFMSPTGTPAFSAANSMQQTLVSHPATPLVLGQTGFASTNGAFVAAAAAAVSAGNQQRRAEETNVFSPLTSPALMPQPGSNRAVAGVYGFGLPMNDATSPHHHPYRGGSNMSIAAAVQAGRKPAAQNRPIDADEFQLDTLSDQSFAAAVVASLQNTPVQLPLQETMAAAAAVSASIAGLNLPDAMVTSASTALGITTTNTAAMDLDQQLAASIAGNSKNRTLHQLNPQGGTAVSRDSVSEDHATAGLTVAQQLDKILGSAQQQQQQQAEGNNNPSNEVAQSNLQPSSAVAMTATPASLMNLPLSAHHLPHTSTGEIISPEPAQETPTLISNPAASMQQAADKAIAATLAELTRTIPTTTTPLLDFITQSAPMTELMHPPLPPPLQIGPSSTEASGSLQKNKRMRRKSVSIALLSEPAICGGTAAAAAAAAASAGGVAKSRRNGAVDSARGRRRSRLTPLISPRPTPLVPSTLKGISPGMSPQTGPLISPALAPLNSQSSLQQSRQHAESTPGSSTATPQMRPRPMIAATSTTNIVGLEADVVTRLATKSNYQNIMEGNSELLGLKYHKEFKTGLEKRRTNHKQAEQKRRDSLKQCFEQLKDRLSDLDPKLVSKIYLLKKANSLIDSLKRSNEVLANAAREKGVDVDGLLAMNIFDEDNEDDADGPDEDEEDMAIEEQVEAE
ncbi:hypothetical protein J3B02_000508 [Coemansia erecta]|nr:hypothetical protein J3B02_000508 [Coemansia erecta]